MSYSPSQRVAIQQFVAFTQCPERTAAKILKAHSWNVEIAVDTYFTAGATLVAANSATVSSLNNIFDQFREHGDPVDMIGVNGSMNFLQAIDIGLEEQTVLVVCELLKAPTMGEFSRDGFVEGWKALGCDSLEKMRSKVPSLRAAMNDDEATFKKVYLFTYSFARTPGQKSLPLETAIEYWKLLLGKRFQAYLPKWIEFLETVYKKSIAKDTWNCMYDFVQLAASDPGLAGYDVDGAWPSILDDFVEFVRKRESMDTS